jgi:hypothetical protein
MFFNNTWLCVINEVSFALYEAILGKISTNLKLFMETMPTYTENMVFVFLGTSANLKPSAVTGLYWEQALTCMCQQHGQAQAHSLIQQVYRHENNHAKFAKRCFICRQTENSQCACHHWNQCE